MPRRRNIKRYWTKKEKIMGATIAKMGNVYIIKLQTPFHRLQTSIIIIKWAQIWLILRNKTLIWTQVRIRITRLGSFLHNLVQADNTYFNPAKTMNKWLIILICSDKENVISIQSVKLNNLSATLTTTMLEANLRHSDKCFQI